MTQVIGTGRYNRLLQRLLDMKADPPAPDLAGEIMPVMVLESNRPEWEFLKGGRLAMAPGGSAANAGQVSRTRFRNPAASNVILVVEAFLISRVTAGRVFGFVHSGTAVDLPTVGAIRTLDTRLQLTSSAAIISTDNTGAAAPTGGTAWTMRMGANSPIYLPTVMVISPGRGLDVVSSDTNVDLDVSIFYRERGVEASELL